MAKTYELAPEVERYGKKLVKKYHAHLDNYDIVYLFVDKASKKNKHVVMAKAGLAPLFSRILADVGKGPACHFVMIVAKPEWQGLDEKQREALVDHELCHMGLNKDGDPTLLQHDIQEFNAIIERHGLWYQDIKETSTVMKKAEEQLAMFGKEVKGDHADLAN